MGRALSPPATTMPHSRAPPHPLPLPPPGHTSMSSPASADSKSTIGPWGRRSAGVYPSGEHIANACSAHAVHMQVLCLCPRIGCSSTVTCTGKSTGVLTVVCAGARSLPLCARAPHASGALRAMFHLWRQSLRNIGWRPRDLLKRENPAAEKTLGPHILALSDIGRAEPSTAPLPAPTSYKTPREKTRYGRAPLLRPSGRTAPPMCPTNTFVHSTIPGSWWASGF